MKPIISRLLVRQRYRTDVNLSVHTGERVRQMIEARGGQVLFLPAYSPDFTPIEEAFSKLKA
jgi:transposase